MRIPNREKRSRVVRWYLENIFWPLFLALVKCVHGPIFEYAIEGDVSKLRQEIQQKNKPPEINDFLYSWTPLAYAAMFGNVDACVELVRQGANVHTPCGSESLSPLHIAAKYGSVAAARELACLGSPTDLRNVYNETPLHLAAQNGHTEMCKLLLNIGADRHAEGRNVFFFSRRNNADETFSLASPYAYAIRSVKLECARFLEVYTTPEEDMKYVENRYTNDKAAQSSNNEEANGEEDKGEKAKEQNKGITDEAGNILAAAGANALENATKLQHDHQLSAEELEREKKGLVEQYKQAIPLNKEIIVELGTKRHQIEQDCLVKASQLREAQVGSASDMPARQAEIDVLLLRLEEAQMAKKFKMNLVISPKGLENLATLLTIALGGFGFVISCDRGTCLALILVQVVLLTLFFWNLNRQFSDDSEFYPPPQPRLLIEIPKTLTREMVIWKVKNGTEVFDHYVPLTPLTENYAEYMGKVVSEQELHDNFMDYVATLEKHNRVTKNMFTRQVAVSKEEFLREAKARWEAAAEDTARKYSEYLDDWDQKVRTKLAEGRRHIKARLDEVVALEKKRKILHYVLSLLLLLMAVGITVGSQDCSLSDLCSVISLPIGAIVIVVTITLPRKRQQVNFDRRRSLFASPQEMVSGNSFVSAAQLHLKARKGVHGDEEGGGGGGGGENGGQTGGANGVVVPASDPKEPPSPSAEVSHGNNIDSSAGKDVDDMV